MGRAARKRGLPRLAGAESGVHRLKVAAPRSFEPEEDRKRGGKIHRMDGGACGKLSRKRNDSNRGPGLIGTDEIPHGGLKLGTKLMRKDGGAAGNWMKTAVKHPGALHRDLHVPQGEKIPESKIKKAEHSKDPTIRRRAVLAETFRKHRP